jgi:hypothetical protein
MILSNSWQHLKTLTTCIPATECILISTSPSPIGRKAPSEAVFTNWRKRPPASSDEWWRRFCLHLHPASSSYCRSAAIRSTLFAIMRYWSVQIECRLHSQLSLHCAVDPSNPLKRLPHPNSPLYYSTHALFHCNSLPLSHKRPWYWSVQWFNYDQNHGQRAALWRQLSGMPFTLY